MAQKKKPKFTTVSGIPCWAASYLEDADSSGLNDEDKKLADDYKKKLLKEGLKLVAPIEDTRNEFNRYPAFGLACDTEDWSAEVIPPDRIVFRKYWNMHDRRWGPVAFLPDAEAKPGFVMSYEHTGQHGEASLDWYWRATKPCPEGEYAWLLDEMVQHYGYRPKIMKKLILRRD